MLPCSPLSCRACESPRAPSSQAGKSRGSSWSAQSPLSCVDLLRTEIFHLALWQVFKCTLGCISFLHLCALPQDQILVSVCTCLPSQLLFPLCLQIHYILNLSASLCLVQSLGFCMFISPKI